MARFGFDISETEYNERGEFEIIPKGTEVTLKATEAEEKKTSAGTGSYIAVTFEVTKGEHVGRKIWQNFNVHNPNDKAEKIGREQIAGWARACGKPNAQDTDELLERPFNAKLGIEKGTGGYSDKNKIDSFLLPSAGNAPAPKSKPAPTPAAEESDAKQEPAKESPSKSAANPSPAPAGAKKRNPWDD